MAWFHRSADTSGNPHATIGAAAATLAAVALILDLAGGAVPGIAHQVASGHLPPLFDPERYLGPPYAGSISGAWAAAGALVWAGFVVLGLIALRCEAAAGVFILTIATATAAFVNVALPLLQPSVGWSVLGIGQTGGIAAALLVISATRFRLRRHEQCPESL